MIKRLSKIGNSYGVLVEKPILDLLGIDADAEIELTTDGVRLVLTPTSRAKIAAMDSIRADDLLLTAHRARERADKAEGRAAELCKLLREAVAVIRWCGGSAEIFYEGGKERDGWEKYARPVLTRADAALSGRATPSEKTVPNRTCVVCEQREPHPEERWCEACLDAIPEHRTTAAEAIELMTWAVKRARAFRETTG